MTAYAQPATDAGALIKQVDEQRQKIQKEHELPIPLPESAVSEVSAKDQVKITVSRFRFKGNTLLDDKQLSAIVKKLLHRPFTYVQLQEAAAMVGDAYRKKGWAVRVFLPQQDIVNGVVEINIIEAKFGKVLLEKDSHAWPPKARIDAPHAWVRNVLVRATIRDNTAGADSPSSRLRTMT